jgi:hypothetical protein
MKRLPFVSFLLCLALFTACEKPEMTEDKSSPTERGNLTLSVSQVEQTSFSALTRAAASEVCTNLNFVIYDMEGTRLKYNNQKKGDEDFGTVSFQLEEGSYQIMVLAHSADRNPTTTNPKKIQFSSNTNKKGTGYTDTFLYYTTVTLDSEPQTLSLSLRRIVSLCRFVISDAIPEGVDSLVFTYKGGSGYFDASTGLGVTSSTSQQKAYFKVQTGSKNTQYDLYTFLPETEGTIHLVVSAYNAANIVQLEREIDVPMVQNRITWLTGNFFTDFTPIISQTLTPTVNIDNDWGGEDHMDY